MSEPDEAAVQAVADAIYRAAPGATSAAHAVLATPVVADWRRDAELLAKVQAIVDEPIYQAEVKAVQLVRYHRIADMVGGQS